MSYTAEEIVQWFDREVNSLDYIIIDPPWNYTKPNYSSLWDSISYQRIFQNCKTDYIFIWTTLDNLASLMWHQTESDYELKALLPWIRSTSSIDSTTSVRVCGDYLAVFCKPGVSFLRNLSTTMIVEDTTMSRPRNWEERFVQMLEGRDLKGRYMSLLGFISFKVHPKVTIHKNTLF